MSANRYVSYSAVITGKGSIKPLGRIGPSTKTLFDVVGAVKLGIPI